MTSSIGKTSHPCANPIHIAVLFILFLLGLIWFSWNFLPWKERKLERIVNAKLESTLTKGQKIIRVKDIVSFEWEKVCYISGWESYHSQNKSPTSIDTYLGRSYTGYIPRSSCRAATYNDLVFIRGQEIVGIAPIHNCTLGVKYEKKAPFCFGKNAKINVTVKTHPKFGIQEELILTE